MEGDNKVSFRAYCFQLSGRSFTYDFMASVTYLMHVRNNQNAFEVLLKSLSESLFVYDGNRRQIMKPFPIMHLLVWRKEGVGVNRHASRYNCSPGSGRE